MPRYIYGLSLQQLLWIIGYNVYGRFVEKDSDLIPRKQPQLIP